MAKYKDKLEKYVDTSNKERTKEQIKKVSNAIRRMTGTSPSLAGTGMKDALMKLWQQGFDYGYEEREKDYSKEEEI